MNMQCTGVFMHVREFVLRVVTKIQKITKHFSFWDAKRKIINHYFGPNLGFIWERRDHRLPFVPAAQPRVWALRWRCMCLVFDKIKITSRAIEIRRNRAVRAAGFRSLGPRRYIKNVSLLLLDHVIAWLARLAIWSLFSTTTTTTTNALLFA